MKTTKEQHLNSSLPTQDFYLNRAVSSQLMGNRIGVLQEDPDSQRNDVKTREKMAVCKPGGRPPEIPTLWFGCSNCPPRVYVLEV